MAGHYDLGPHLLRIVSPPIGRGTPRKGGKKVVSKVKRIPVKDDGGGA